MARPVVGKDGKANGTVRQHYAGMVRQGRAEYRARIEGPGLPAYLLPLWGLYREVADGKSAGGLGPAVLTWGDVAAWQAVAGATVTAWEAEQLFAMDAALLAGLSGKD